MSEIHVLGIGSPFGDDQLGWEIVELLQQRPKLSRFIPNQLYLACCDRPGIYLLELMRDTQIVYLIDAIKTGAAIGTLHHFENTEIQALDDSLSSHHLGIAAAMKIGETLKLLPSKVILYGIEIGIVQHHFILSKPIEHAIQTLSLLIENELLSSLDSLMKLKNPIRTK